MLACGPLEDLGSVELSPTDRRRYLNRCVSEHDEPELGENTEHPPRGSGRCAPERIGEAEAIAKRAVGRDKSWPERKITIQRIAGTA